MIFKLKEIGKIVTGTTPKTSITDYYSNDDYMFIGPSDLQNGKYIRKTEKHISSKAYSDYKTRFLNVGDICVSCIGYVGYVAKPTQLSLSNQQINSITQINENVVLSEYLFYKLLSMNEYFQSINGNGSAVPIINKTIFENIEVDIHNLEEQQHIVDILGTLDEKIEYYDKLINSLERDGELIFKDFIENKSLLKAHICLSDIATFYNGYSYSGDELCEQSEDALVTIKNFDRDGGFKIEGLKPIKITGKIKPTMFVELGDLLVAHTDLTQNADIIGNPIILLNLGNYKKAAISMDLVKVESSKLSKEFLYYILKNSDFKAHALGYCSGTTVLHLNKKALQEYEFDLPLNDSIIEKVNDKLKTIFDRIQNAFIERQKLTELKQLYLQKFFG